MSPARFTVDRPVFTVMATLIAMTLGGIALSRLPIDLMPDVTYPTLSVTTAYPDVGPLEVEELVTRPLEEALAAVPGVEELTSISAEGQSSVRVTFTWGTDLDAAANDIRDRLDRVIAALPEEAERPTLRKFDLASFPILILGAGGDLDPISLRELVEEQLKYRLERIPGVAAVDVDGGLEREVHVNLRLDELEALAIPLDQILTRIRAQNVNLPAGTIERGAYDVTVRTPGQFGDLDELRDTVIELREGAPVRLRDIATVEDTTQRQTRIVRVNGKPGVRLRVNKQSGTNTVEVARGVLEEVHRINRDLPQVQLTSIIDTAEYIERSITNVARSAAYGGLLAVLVLLVFLRSARSTVVIATAIPVSIVATFALVYFCGFTLNIMTLGGLALGVGMLVDNAIVVLENVYRLRERGLDPRRAAVEGTQEVAGAILASTLTTLAVFLPLVFVQGMSGVMFRQLAIVVGFALLCSIVVSLTLVPMLAARLLREEAGGAAPARWASALAALAARPLDAAAAAYDDLLASALRRPWAVALTGAGLLGASLLLVPFIGAELMPTTDEGEVRIDGEMDVGTRVELVDRTFQRIEALVAQAVPEVRSSVGYIGGTSWRATGGHTGQLRLALVPQRERTRSSEQIAAALRAALRDIPGVTIRTRAGGGLFLLRMGTGGLERLEVDVRGHDLETADALARQVLRLVEDVDGVTDARISRELGAAEELVLIDRRKAADLGLTVSDVAQALQTALAGSSAGAYRDRGDEYRILVKVGGAERMPLERILDLTLTNGRGDPVVLRNVVEVAPRRGPVRIERKDQERVVTISVNLGDRDLGSVVADIRERLEQVTQPRGFEVVFGGDYESQQEAFRELLLAFVLSLLLVYMVMACLYESLRDPLVVMLSVPTAATGVLVTLFLTDTTFNIQSFIGCIMLGGIVVNNAILLVDHTNLLRDRDGLPLADAAREAGRRRLRPILMTTLTTAVGLVPMALGVGEGGETQAPMARAVIGGLLSSTLVTLLLVPTVLTRVGRRAPSSSSSPLSSGGAS